MIDVTPQIPRDIKVIKAYGVGMFDISGEIFKKNIILYPQKVEDYDIFQIQEEKDFLNYVLSIKKNLDNDYETLILLIGTGESRINISQELYFKLHENSVVADVMSTSAACRTYNILISEGRNVVAFLKCI